MPRAVKAMTNGAGRGMPSAPCLMWAFGASPKVGPDVLEFGFVAGEQALETKLLELGGMKWGYANHYYRRISGACSISRGTMR